MSDEKHVLPVKKTKLSEELHTVDLSKYGLHATNATGKKIRVVRNPSVAMLYEYALSREENTTITSTGALVAYSGEKTGRSPADKRIVDTEPENKDVFWGNVNIKLPQHSFDINKERALDYLNTKDTLFVVDAFAGWEPTARMKVRVICSRAYHALFMLNMLIRANEQELATFGEPDIVIYNAGEFPANRQTQGMTSKASVDLNLKTRELVILGTQYAGEMKKGVFSFFHYFMPLKGYLSLHSSANMGAGGDVSLFFGLSGTGKTTLSADPRRFLIGDDEHVWFENGLFNIEGGCYAKVDKLSKEQEPEIFGAIKFGSVLENVVLDSMTHEVDFNDLTITENTRASYPIEYIPNARIPCVGGHPKNIILLTCDAFGVLPPVSRLTPLQTQYHFITGYTAKVAGTEVGVTEPKATFSSCFGEAFIVHHPAKYADLLAKLMEKHNANAWLVNTGWVGGGYGVGSRIKLKYTRAMLDAIHDGSLLTAEYKAMDNFGLQIPLTCKGVPDEVLFPRQAWKDQAKYDQTLKKLAEMFVKNFDKYKAGVAPQVVESGPKL